MSELKITDGHWQFSEQIAKLTEHPASCSDRMAKQLLCYMLNNFLCAVM